MNHDQHLQQKLTHIARMAKFYEELPANAHSAHCSHSNSLWGLVADSFREGLEQAYRAGKSAGLEAARKEKQHG